MKKQYVYITKEDGILIPHFVFSDNRKKVKNEFGVCIDNIYDYNMLLQVIDWYYRVYGKKIVLTVGHRIFFTDLKNMEYIKTFSEFREIVNDYRNRE